VATVAGGTTPTAASGTTTFDPSKVKKLAVESGATLRISGGGSTAEQDQFRQQLARFSQVYPEVKINYEPNPEDYNTKLKAQISSKTEPDVFNFEPPLTEEFIGANVVLDLAPYMAEIGRKQSDYFESLMKIYSRGDKVYGVPRDFNSLFFFYNTEMVASSGATTPKEGWTQADMRAFAEKASQGTDPNSKVYGLDTEADYARWVPIALANGATILSADGKKCTINSTEGAAALDYWYGMYKDKVATTKADVGTGWAGETFAKKRSASAIEGGWLIPFLDDPKAGFGVKYDVAPLPTGKNGGKGNFLFTNAWAASARSQFPKAAAALILFITGPENQQAVLESGFALPTLKGFENNAFFKGTGVVNRAAAINYAAAAYGIADYYGPATDKIHKSLTDALTRVFAGQQDSAAALNQACTEIDAGMQP
jgi:multiple sugar transport system substrate-binding protein